MDHRAIQASEKEVEEIIKSFEKKYSANDLFKIPNVRKIAIVINFDNFDVLEANLKQKSGNKDMDDKIKVFKVIEEA